MSNRKIIENFESHALVGEFHHADHVRLAFAYLSANGAMPEMASGCRATFWEAVKRGVLKPICAICEARLTDHNVIVQDDLTRFASIEEARPALEVLARLQEETAAEVSRMRAVLKASLN